MELWLVRWTCFNFVFAFVPKRCLMVQLLCCPWPQWWHPQWPMGPAAPGTPSASSSHYAFGGSRGSLMVRQTKTFFIFHQNPDSISRNLKVTHKIHTACQWSSSSFFFQKDHTDAAKWPRFSMIIQIICYSEQYSYWSFLRVNCCHSATLTCIDCKRLAK